LGFSERKSLQPRIKESFAMKLAIMQPYLFPYIGYFQLIHTVDKFVLLDDVNYIKKGWINRNRILVNGGDFLFTIPLSDASQNKWINQIWIQDDPKWREKFLKVIQSAYSKAPYFPLVFPLIEKIIGFNKLNLSAYIHNSLKILCDYLQISTPVISSSGIYENRELKGSDRILDICLKEKATEYINPSGGLDLYNREVFKKEGVHLQFLRSLPVNYPQFKNEFVPYLSVIDVLMFNDSSKSRTFLTSFELL